MPAPELTPQTPGETLVAADPANAAANNPTPDYLAKHNGGGRWRIYSNAADDWFSEFVAVGEGAKELAEAEAERLNAGGEPYVKPADEPPVAKPAPKASKSPANTGTINATTLKQPVMTDEGWLCPEPAVKE